MPQTKPVERHHLVLLFTIAVLVLSALSSHGALDKFADDRLDRTIAESFAIYGLARLLNATVSVFQSSELGATFGATASIKVGEMLDPINDAIERLSSVMAWAIGSLLLQNIVLTLVSGNVFKWLFALIGVATILTLIIARNRPLADASGMDALTLFCGMIVKIFILAAIVRFIVPVFVIASYLSAQVLLQTEVDSERSEVSTIKEQVSVDNLKNLDQFAADEGEKEPAPEMAGGFLGRWFDTAKETVKNLPSISKPDLSKFPVLLEHSVNLAERLTRLLILISVKNIILPLIFLALALKFIKPVTTYLLAVSTTIKQELKEIRSEKYRALPVL